jgi:hypothetical protein
MRNEGKRRIIWVSEGLIGTDLQQIFLGHYTGIYS